MRVSRAQCFPVPTHTAGIARSLRSPVYKRIPEDLQFQVQTACNHQCAAVQQRCRCRDDERPARAGWAHRSYGDLRMAPGRNRHEYVNRDTGCSTFRLAMNSLAPQENPLPPNRVALSPADPFPQSTRSATAIAVCINEAYRMAQTCAEDAIKHAIRCGELLVAQRSQLAHGEFQKWAAESCEFASTATLYMRAAKQTANGFAVSSLGGLFASGEGAAARVQHESFGESSPDGTDNSPSTALVQTRDRRAVERDNREHLGETRELAVTSAPLDIHKIISCLAHQTGLTTCLSAIRPSERTSKWRSPI